MCSPSGSSPYKPGTDPASLMRGPTIIGTGSPGDEEARTDVEFACECHVTPGSWGDADPHTLGAFPHVAGSPAAGTLPP